MNREISFILDGKIQTIDFNKHSHLKPTTTILQYLRGLPDHKGVKEGCAEGDCGACTVVLAEPDANGGMIYKAVNSCLLFLPKLHRKQLITIENLKDPQHNLHPVQRAVAEQNGSQCGFCTPGIVMSLFGQYKSGATADRDQIEDTLSGNLCRCTGYQPILEAAEDVLAKVQADHFTVDQEQVLKLLNSIQAKSLNVKTEQQQYLLPNNLQNALQLYSTNPQALIIDGASDVALRVTKMHEQLPFIIDLSNIPELKTTQKTSDNLVIGSGVPINELMGLTQNDFPAIHKICQTFGSNQIRNVATIGGNLGSASPIGDLAPVLIAYNAEIILQSDQGERTLKMDAFLKGYRKTALKPGEIIKSISLPIVNKQVKVGAYKISKRRDLDIATVSAGFRIEINLQGVVQNCALVYGGMAAMTAHAVKAEKFLNGKKWTRKTVEETIPIIRESFTPISDARSGAEFRSLAVGNLMLKFWQENQ